MFLKDIIPSLLCIHCHNLYEEYGSVEKLKIRSTSRRLEWVMWKMRQKTVQWKNVSRQGCEDICTANFNYEHWPLSFSASLPSFLLSLTDQLVKWKRKHWRARWLEEAGKLRHHIETHSETEQMDTHTKKKFYLYTEAQFIFRYHFCPFTSIVFSVFLSYVPFLPCPPCCVSFSFQAWLPRPQTHWLLGKERDKKQKERGTDWQFELYNVGRARFKKKW